MKTNWYDRLSSRLRSRSTIEDRIVNAIPYNIDEILLSKGISFLKNRYGLSITLSSDEIISKFNNYIKDLDPYWEKRKKKISKAASRQQILDDQIIMINPENNTFIIIRVGNFLDKFSNRRYSIFNNYNNNDREDTQSTTEVYFFGKKAKKYYNQVMDVINYVSDNLVIYNVSNSDYSERGKDSLQSVVSDLNCRNIDTLFYADDTKQQVIDHIDNFFKNKDIYESRSINFKTGILLYGEPGTGKSSLINALAVKYGLNIISIDINKFNKLDIPLLTSCINGDDLTYIVAIEDIDLVFNLSRENVETESYEDDEDEREDIDDEEEFNTGNNTKVANSVITDKKDNAVIHKLLQFLDSNSSPSNVIFIATTNCVDKLDKAILREGRFDKKIHIGPINRDVAREMCKSFDCTDKQTEEILSKIPGDKINQSKLQAMILSNIKERMVKEDNEEIIIDSTESESSED